jgi:hypothetical protein
MADPGKPASRPRHWARRLVYVIAAGGALAGAAAWGLRRAPWDRWLIARLDRYARSEYGVGVTANRLEIHPLSGRVVVRGLTVGGDLLQADALELDLEWASLLRDPHLRLLRLEAPRLTLDRARLAQIRPRPHPGAATPKVLLDRLEIVDGQAQVLEPAWGFDRGECRFQATGQGRSANQLQFRFSASELTVVRGRTRLQGSFTASTEVTENRLAVDQARLLLGASEARLRGGLGFRQLDLNATVDGRLDLPELQRLARPDAAPEGAGQVTFEARLAGPADDLSWRASCEGKGIALKGLPLHPGLVRISADGSKAGVRLQQVTWSSQDGRLEGSGGWSPRFGARFRFRAAAIPLGPVAGYTRTGFLKDLEAAFEGEAFLPPDVSWDARTPENLSFRGTGQLLRGGEPAGALDLTLESGRFRASAVDLELPELTFHGSASGSLGQDGLDAIRAEGSADTDAAGVAGVLRAWDIGMNDAAGKLAALDMAGRTHAEATVQWDRGAGFRLQGSAEVEQPRWHGAVADRMRTDVAIDGTDLRLSGIELEKGDGRGYGDLWLTWADLPKGRDQIDMCYRAFRLPVREGLRAADLGDLELDGTGSGWVRLHGPYDRLTMEGSASVEQGSVYGLAIPAVSADFAMDIDAERLRLSDLRVADSPGHLGDGPGQPSGPLALRGDVDMDAHSGTWQVTLGGDLDSALLGLSGPRLQAQVTVALDGPFTEPFGPIQLPSGTVAFSNGRLTLAGETQEDLEGDLTFRNGALEARLGIRDRPARLLTLEALQSGRGRLQGDLALEVGPDSADTAGLASRLTQDFLKDGRLAFHAQGDWSSRGLTWEGRMDRFDGQFEGFRLYQPHPGRFRGDLQGMELTMTLDGRAAAPAAEASGPGTGFPRRRHGLTPAATSMTLSGRLPFRADGQLALELAGGSNLAHLKTILDRIVQPGQYSLLADLHPEGDARFDLRLGGSYSQTTLDGTLTLQGGRAVLSSSPLGIENLGFTAQFKGRDIIIPRSAPLRGRFSQGDLTAWGRMTWHLGGVESYDLHTTLEDFQLRDLPNGFEMEGSLDANLRGSDQDGGRLTGSIWARRTYYHTEINLSDLILSTALGPGSTLSGLDPADPLARIDLDLALYMAEPWELDTNLLKLQGRPRGPLRIQGNLVQPGLRGRMELLPGGRLTNLFPAGDIIIERGTVDFADPTSFNPSLDVQGQIDIPPYLVNLDIVGTLDALQARPWSTPSLRQDEIFAILIDPGAVTSVGGSPNSASSSQTALTTGLASTSTGLLTSLALANFQEQLRRTLNLDRVNVALRTGVGSAPETAITVGKSVNLLGYRTPLVFTHDKTGEVTTISGQMEWRFGDFLLRLGASQSTADSLAPSGVIRHTWSPK